MNKTTEKTKTTQGTKTGEQAHDTAPAASETQTQPTETKEPPTETPLVTTGSEPPEQREYTRNVEETNLSLMLHSPRLYSELSHYFKPELFAEKPTAQLWKLMSRGKVTARLEAVENRLALLESQADVTPVHTSKARLIQELLAANPALTVPEIQGRTGIKADTIRKIMLQQKRSEGKEG